MSVAPSDRPPQFGYVLSCEHASHALPSDSPALGLTDQVLQSHVGWDQGAKELALPLAYQLQAPLQLGEYTRLLVDLNRSQDNPQVIPEVAFGVPVPGNKSLAPTLRLRRLEQYYSPYRNAVRQRIAKALEQQGACLHISVHSFTPDLNPQKRCFDIGLLFDPSRRWELWTAQKLARKLEQHGYSVRFNEPYSGTEDGIPRPYRMRLPNEMYAGVEIEVNHSAMRPGWIEPLVGCLVRGLKD